MAEQLIGIDVSHHQGQVDWAQVVEAGYDFAFVKATEGTGFVDSQLARNKAEMAKVGIIGGFYHFLRDDSDPAKQARHFLSKIGDPDGWLIALDVESGSQNSRPNQTHVQEWFAEFRRLTNHPVFIYTGAWYWRDTIGNPNGASFGPLWHSEYETSQAEIADGPEGAHYGGWTSAAIWQFTSSGSVPGVKGNCDRNISYLDRHKLHAMTNQEVDLDATQNRLLTEARKDVARIKQLAEAIHIHITDDEKGEVARRLKENLILTRGIAARDMSPDMTEEDVDKLTDAVVASLTEEGVPQALASQVLVKLGQALNVSVEAPKPQI